MARELRGAPHAKVLRGNIEAQVQALNAQGIRPALVVLRVGDREDDVTYTNSVVKRCESVGVLCHAMILPLDCDTDTVLQTLHALNEDEAIHGVLLMRPLPKHIDEQRVRDALDPHKDVDGMTGESLRALFTGEGSGFAPCTAQAVMALLQAEGIALCGQEVVVIGRSLVVGKPLSMLLLQENATVTICHTRTKDLAAVCGRADILIACAGQRGMVQPSFVKPGAVLCDVGIHVDEAGALWGDIHPDAYENAGAYTPVPGGVGVLTSWLLIEHVVSAAAKGGRA